MSRIRTCVGADRRHGPTAPANPAALQPRLDHEAGEFAIETAAISYIAGPEMLRRCRKPEIVADAAHAILTSDARSFTGRFCIDDDVLREAGGPARRREPSQVVIDLRDEALAPEPSLPVE